MGVEGHEEAEPQSHTASLGAVMLPGRRAYGVPGADKRISWHGRSDSGWDASLTNSMIDTGVNFAVTPLYLCTAEAV